MINQVIEDIICAIMIHRALYLVMAVLFLASCTAPIEPAPITPVPVASPTFSPDIPTQTIQPTLYPADSEFPAAGICAEAQGEVIEVIISPQGPPDPRCYKVRPDQSLNFSNGTQREIDLQLAGYNIHLEIGESYLLDIPVGEFLAVGNHLIVISGGGGFAPEIWLAG
jgi:hypothetical protein